MKNVSLNSTFLIIGKIQIFEKKKIYILEINNNRLLRGKFDFILFDHIY